MSNASQAIRLATQRPGRFPHASIGTLLWITLVWVLLWGEMTPGNVLAGVLVAFVVTWAVPFPADRFDTRFRPWALVRLGVIFAWDLVVASLKVTWFVLSGRRPRGAIIRVALASESDAYLSITAGMSALVPGTVVVDAHGPSGTLYVHVFDVGLSGGVSAAHSSILQLEERILRAFASRAELIAAGYVPGSTPRSGRLPRPFAPAAPESFGPAGAGGATGMAGRTAASGGAAAARAAGEAGETDRTGVDRGAAVVGAGAGTPGAGGTPGATEAPGPADAGNAAGTTGAEQTPGSAGAARAPEQADASRAPSPAGAGGEAGIAGAPGSHKSAGSHESVAPSGSHKSAGSPDSAGPTSEGRARPGGSGAA